ncbi:hypothetical protein AURDEDRAFT_113224 [Auricularia subglabra TFB-10046 SS5]|nr:hypothetical protein AURDEDRAFT_113224 [Auricularia subglabra TFB-10046 SS5]
MVPLVKPMREKYNALQRKGNKAVVFCLLLNRAHFMRDASSATLNISRGRAALCELLAMDLLDEWEDILDLAAVTTIAWPIFNGADSDVLAKANQYGVGAQQERVGNAIEMAIISKAKRFIKSNSCQKVIDNIWSGKCVYTAESSHSIISDTYKRNPIRLYDPHKAPLLDHYRLKVPVIRSVLEYWSFLLLFILFIAALENNNVGYLTNSEIVFMIYAFGFSLEKVATMQEHGLRVYVNGTWNGFDLVFVTIYTAYFSLRLHGIYNHHQWAREAGLDILALAAVLIFPRLAFVTLSNNLLVLSLRSMFSEFANLMFIAAFIFAGFLYALWTLSRGTGRETYDPGQITWWMLDLWFGLDATGFQLSTNFHPVFGPILFVLYACLSNTLLLTVLVSILSHTFTTISGDAEAEAMFRRAVSTIEGVKADALFSYLPPVNIIALVFFLPLSYILSPRWFHKVNVMFIRVANLPILLTIAFYERQAEELRDLSFYEAVGTLAERIYDALPRKVKRLIFFEGLVGGGPDIDAVFEIEEELEEEAEILDSRIFSPSQIALHGQAQEEQVKSGTEHLPPPFGTDSSAAPTNASTPAPPTVAPTPAGEVPPPLPAPTVERPATPPAQHDFPRSPSPVAPTMLSSTPSSPGGGYNHHPPHMIPMPPRPRRRSRLHSQMQRPDLGIGPQVPSSPLAQIYQPVIAVDLEEDIPEDSELPPGPAGARRRLSMHRRTATEPMNNLPMPSPMPVLQPRRTPTAMGGLSASRHVSGAHSGIESTSPLGLSESPRGDVGHVAEHGTSHADSDLVARLATIEARQARIEELLQRLVSAQGR